MVFLDTHYIYAVFCKGIALTEAIVQMLYSSQVMNPGGGALTHILDAGARGANEESRQPTVKFDVSGPNQL